LTGGRQSEDIVNWLKKKTGPPATELKSDEEVQKFKTDNEVVVIGHFSVSCLYLNLTALHLADCLV